MCGIAGFWGEIAQTPDALARLERMTAALSHRGPDGKSCWLGMEVGVGHTRLAIISKGISRMLRHWLLTHGMTLSSYLGYPLGKAIRLLRDSQYWTREEIHVHQQPGTQCLDASLLRPRPLLSRSYEDQEFASG